MTNGPIAAALAVKRLEVAKSRLATGRDGPGTAHRALVLAMLADTVAAVRAAGIDRIVVVSPDDEVLGNARSYGAEGIREDIARPDETGDLLNHAFALGAGSVRQRWPDTATMVFVQADLPAATPTALREVLVEAHGHRQAMITDRDGSGTTILIRDAGLAEHPSFGPNSAAAHRDSGVVELDPEHLRWPELRTDVDTAADLEDARRLGLGARTAAQVRTKRVGPSVNAS